MVEAAYRLFAERGYGVPLTDIAREAGVAVQTLYFTFHSKAELMQEVLSLAVLGDDLPLAPHQRPWFAKLVAEPDARKALRIMVDGTQPIFERVAPLVGIFQTADPDLTTLWEHSEQLRLEGYRSPVMDALAKKGRLKRGLDLDAGTDILFVLLAPQLYREVVTRRGWSAERWRKWIAETLADAIFA
ncbi:MAG: TetR/AcrR family transcriptional regulator [Candidatus Dormibacteraeota bacterium]|nr:TetR/AcrR family transcriptional regulator [Candidatus Dormibacteraeota bacterium]